MYMNMNGILAAQRPGAGLAGLPGGAAGPAPAASAGRDGCGWRGSQSLAGKDFQGAPPVTGSGLRGPLSVAPGVPGRFMSARPR
jgi:hypothetical protein